MTDPIQRLRGMMTSLDRWDGICMSGDMAAEHDAEVEAYRDAVDAAIPALLAIAEAARLYADAMDAPMEWYDYLARKTVFLDALKDLEKQS